MGKELNLEGNTRCLSYRVEDAFGESGDDGPTSKCTFG